MKSFQHSFLQYIYDILGQLGLQLSMNVGYSHEVVNKHDKKRNSR